MMATATRVKAPFKTFGGKYYLAPWIISLLPPRGSYRTLIDGMVMSGSVMLAHDGFGKSEIVNDRNQLVTNFWQVMQDTKLFARFARKARAIPFSKPEFRAAKALVSALDKRRLDLTTTDDIIDVAVAFFVLARLSRAGDQQEFATVTTGRLRRERNEQVSAWLTAVEGLPEVHKRVMNWLVLDDDVFDLIVKYDKEETVHYYDPPYLKEGENGRVVDVAYGEFDWTPEMHEKFLGLAVNCKHAKLLISGYDTNMYQRLLVKAGGWKVHRSKPQPLHTAGGKEKRLQIECVFTNY
jgi:DNA adenine methylase